MVVRPFFHLLYKNKKNLYKLLTLLNEQPVNNIFICHNTNQQKKDFVNLIEKKL